MLGDLLHLAQEFRFIARTIRRPIQERAHRFTHPSKKLTACCRTSVPLVRVHLNDSSDIVSAMAQRAMMIDFGKSEVFEGHMAHAYHRRVDVHGAIAHLLEQRTELLLIHEARISERTYESCRALF